MSPDPLSFLRRLLNTVDTIGLKRTEEILCLASKPDIAFSNKHVEYVVQVIADEFQMEIGEIIYGSGRKNERRLAVGFCCFYLYHVFHVHVNDIASQLKKVPALVYRYKNEIVTLKPKHVADAKYCAIKEKFDNIFITNKN